MQYYNQKNKLLITRFLFNQFVFFYFLLIYFKKDKSYKRDMTDQALYQHIRKLVKQQKEHNVLDTKEKNFAMSYCNTEMSKKKKCKYKQNDRLDSIFKNFKNVESYINIMDIISKLPIEFNNQDIIQKTQEIQSIKQIVPKSLQIKIREQLGPILEMKYKQQSIKRQIQIDALKNNMDFTNTATSDEVISRQITKLSQNNESQRLQLIDILRKDKKRKMIYYNQKKFDEDMECINKIPENVQHSKLFHKICSYLHMILEQEHKQKWQSKKNKQFRQDCKKQNANKRISIPALIKTSSNLTFKNLNFSSTYPVNNKNLPTVKQNSPGLKTFNELSPRQKTNKQLNLQSLEGQTNKNIKLDANNHKINTQNQLRETQTNLFTSNIITRQSLVKQNFTFRKRCIKAGLISKINSFVQSVNNQQKKNIQASKKYTSALERLQDEIHTSYGKFYKEQIAQDEDIDEMKRYLDNAISKCGKDIGKKRCR